MRKRLTFEELARATLVDQPVVTQSMPYVSPDDNTFAVTELRDELNRMRSAQVTDETARAAETTAAREAQVTPEFMRLLAGWSLY